MAKTRVAIIGAGPSGLSILNSFHGRDEQVELVCFEKQGQAGGIWNYTWRTGLDVHGEPLPNTMYRYLWSNGAKEIHEMADYTFKDHLGQTIPSFPPRQVLLDYVLGRAKQKNLLQYVRFNTVVRNVQEIDSGKRFQVTYHDQNTKLTTEEEFDYVIVASGHFSYPHVPEYPGIEEFSGRVMHARDFRDALEFKGKHVLLIGSSYSAEDISLQLHKYGAEQVTISYRSRPLGYKWPKGIEELPLIKKISGNSIEFIDGNQRSVDAIIFCTGYLYVFPFLPGKLTLTTENMVYPNNLYKGIFWQENPRLIYMGMQDLVYTFILFDAQSWYARDVILGKIPIPGFEDRQVDVENWYNKGQQLKSYPEQIDFQTEYLKELFEATDYPYHDLDVRRRHLHQRIADKSENILTYREKCFKSAVTGNVSTVHHTQWMKAMNDTMAEFMKLSV